MSIIQLSIRRKLIVNTAMIAADRLRVNNPERDMTHIQPKFFLKDQPLMTGGGGATKWENSDQKLFARPPPPSSKQGKTSHASPLFKRSSSLCPPLSMVKVSSACVKTTLKMSSPPHLAWLNLCALPLLLGIKLECMWN